MDLENTELEQTSESEEATDVKQTAATPQDADDKGTEEPESKPAEDEAGEPSKPEPEEISPRKLKRIDRLSEKLRPANNQDIPINQPKPEPYVPVELQDGMDIAAVESDRQKYAESMLQRGVEAGTQRAFQQLAVQDFAKTYEADQRIVEESHGADLSPKMKDYLDNLYQAAVGYDPKTNTIRRLDIRYSDFVDAYMEGAEEIAQIRSAKTAKTVAKQAAQGAITGSASTNGKQRLSREAIAAMTSKEYEERLPEINAWISKNFS